jgi:ATP synthase protein I
VLENAGFPPYTRAALLLPNFSLMGDFLSRKTSPEAFDSQPATEPDFTPLTAAQAQVWRTKNPAVSPWRIVVLQAVVGLLCAVLAGLLWRHQAVLWSALYGAAVVVVPGAFMAHGIGKGISNPAAAAAGFLFWELVKIVVALILLLAAVKVVPHLNWLALVGNMVVCTKIGWWALFKRWPLLLVASKYKESSI